MLRVKPEENLLETSTGSVTYDYLVIATGCVPNFFGMDHIEQRSWPMSDIGDALRIRNSVLRNLEKAVIATSEEERNALLNIVIVGGGASGVEIARGIGRNAQLYRAERLSGCQYIVDAYLSGRRPG